jgi:ATP-dependent DNA helicase RecG
MIFNLDDLERLVKDGESSTLEFKTTTAKLKAAVETLCAYLNGQGGVVLIGVSDSGNIIGQTVTDNTRLEIANSISKLEPASQVDFEYIPIKNDKSVIKMSVAPNPESVPYVFDGRAYWRVLSSTRSMPQSRYQQLLMERANKLSPWDSEVASNLSVADLDHKEIINTISQSISKGRLEARYETHDPLTALRLLKLTSDGKLLNAAAVLFLNDPELNYPQCLLRMVKFKGKEKGNILDSKRIYGHAFHLLSHAEDFYLRHMSIESEFVSGKMARRDIPDYPPRAIREAMVNAISHRDYRIKGGSISLMLFDDRLEITSHGTLPLGITINDLKHAHDSQPRNERITQVMYRCGLVESIGTGTQEMISECKEFGKPAPEYLERANTFVVRFLLRPIPIIPDNLTNRQKEVIDIVSSKNTVSASEILSALSDNPAERTLRDDLAKLKKLNLIDTTGKGRGAVWHLAQDNEAE